MSRPGPPPRWRRWLLRLAPGDDGEHLERELDELYRRRSQERGRRAADRWYRREVLGVIALGRLEKIRETIRTRPGRSRRGGAGGSRVGSLLHDLRHAWRSLRHHPGFAFLAVVTLALGIGASTLIFSVVDHVVVRPLPYAEPDRLVAIWPEFSLLRGEVDILQRHASTLEGVVAYHPVTGFNLQRRDGSSRIRGAMVSPGLLSTLGVEPALGRGFAPEEARAGEDAVALLSWELWRGEYGGDPDVVGSDILLDGRAHRIVGVLSPGFAFPQAGQRVLVPLVMDPADPGTFWGWGGQSAIGRLAPGATARAARAEALELAQSMRQANPLWTPPEDFRDGATVVPLRDALVGGVEDTLLVLMGAVGLVLLVACSNVANLFLARGLSRSREVAVRAALGAGRGRLVREQLVESLLVAVVGCAVALGAAVLALERLVALLPPDVPRAAEISLDVRVAAVGVVAAVLAGALAGLLPALRASGTDPAAVLDGGGRGTSGPGRRRRRLARALVVGQVAAAVVLITGAGLLLRTLGELTAVDPGFRTEDVTTARLTLAGERYEAPGAADRFFERVLEKVRGLGGVEAAALGSHVPFGPGSGGMATFIENVTDDPNSLPVLTRPRISPGYFETMGIPLMEGRDFRADDDGDAPLVAIVDATAAERFWPGESPLGKRIRFPWQGAPWLEVIGVVGGVADENLAQERVATFYVPMAQVPMLEANLVVRSSADPAAVAARVREIVREVDSTVPVSGVAPMERLVAGSMARPRWTAAVLALFAAATLLLGCIGVYGVVAGSVRERVGEFGVRMALGAAPDRIRRGVLLDGARLVLPGAALGLAAALPLGRLLEGLLYGVTPVDPATLLAVPLILILAGILASYLPALRATRVDPVRAIRAEA